MLSAATTLALATALTFAPVVIAPTGYDDAAYAKNGNGNGSGNGNGRGGDRSDRDKGNKGGNGKSDKARGGGKQTRSGKSLSKAFRDSSLGRLLNKGQKKKVQRQQVPTPKATTTQPAATTEITSLHPNQKGRWNASKANQNALDAHIRNGNFNGTIGALAQYQLAGRAAAGQDLSAAEQAALDSFLGEREPVDFSDAELEEILNADATGDMPIFEVENGIASCAENCDADGLDTEANAALDEYRAEQQKEADTGAVEDFYTASEQRILDESNKSTDGIEDSLLDGLASDLGFDRPDFGTPDIAEEPAEAELTDPDAVTDDEDGEIIVEG